jgi:hypothetical protein
MNHQPAEEPTTDELPKIGDGLGRSILAAIVGMAVAGVLVWLVLGVLHPSGWYAVIGIPMACAIVPGLVIGLLDPRRPLVTAPLAAFVFFLGLAVVQTRGAIYGDAWVIVGALGAAFVAGLGAFVGSSVREVRHGGVTTLGIAAVAFIVTFALPELAFRRDADRFVEQHLDDVVDVVSENLVRVPDRGLQWDRELVGGLFRGIELSTEWQDDTPTAGSGHCSLTVRTRWLESGRELDDDIDTIRFRFKPDAPARLEDPEEAAALVRELGVAEPPEGLEKQPTFRWHAWWRPEREGQARPMYEISVERDARVTAKRDIPWLE